MKGATPMTICKMIVLSLSIMTTSMSHAGVLIEDSFDGRLHSDWIISGEDNDTSFSVVEGGESAFSANMNSSALLMTKQGGVQRSQIEFYLPDGLKIRSGKSLTVQFGYKAADKSAVPLLQIKGQGKNAAARLSFYDALKNREGEEWNTLNAQDTEVWYRVTYTYHNNREIDTVDIMVESTGGTKESWVGLPVESSVDVVESVVFKFNGNNVGSCLIDNVIIRENSRSQGTIGLLLAKD